MAPVLKCKFYYALKITGTSEQNTLTGACACRIWFFIARGHGSGRESWGSGNTFKEVPFNLLYFAHHQVHNGRVSLVSATITKSYTPQQQRSTSDAHTINNNGEAEGNGELMGESYLNIQFETIPIASWIDFNYFIDWLVCIHWVAAALWFNYYQMHNRDVIPGSEMSLISSVPQKDWLAWH